MAKATPKQTMENMIRVCNDQGIGVVFSPDQDKVKFTIGGKESNWMTLRDGHFYIVGALRGIIHQCDNVQRRYS